MKFVSTRDRNKKVGFQEAILNCMPDDGGLYVPEAFADLRRWILYTNEKTTFTSIAGTLTSALINDEFSPIISETIASKAFPFEPKIEQIDNNLFALKLYETPTGSHKDFGINYLVNCVETIHTLYGGTSIFLDATNGELGASLARAIKGKQNIKAVLLYAKGQIRSLCEEDFVWNGGNVYPVEVDGTEEVCHKIVRAVFNDKNLVQKYNLTVANTANIGRLLPQMFFYPYAFSKIKSKVSGDIFYSMPCGNYSNLVAGLYSWKVSLPLSGFICPATSSLTNDFMKSCIIPDDIVPFHKRLPCDPASPSNLERLEDIFERNTLMLKHFVFPANLTSAQIEDSCRELFMKYGIFADKNTSSAFASLTDRKELFEEDEGSVVLVMRDHPSLDKDFIQHNTGESPEIPENIKKSLLHTEIKKPLIKEAFEVEEILKSITF